MGFWGALAGTTATVLTGNPTFAVAGVSTLGGGGGGPATSCPGQPNEDAAFLLSIISAADRAALRAAAPAGGTTAIIQTAIDRGDAVTLAFHVAGGDDCQVTSDSGKRFVALFRSLVDKYRASTSSSSPATTGPYSGAGGGFTERVLEPLGETFGNIARGAVAGASAAASGAQIGSQTALAGTGFGATLVQWAPILLAVLLAFLILRK